METVIYVTDDFATEPTGKLARRLAELAPGGPQPDILNYAWRDYGNRVGVFRLMEVLDRYNIRATVALNSDICIHHPEIIEEGEKRRWEWMGHNQSNSRRLNEVPADEEPVIIRDALDTIARASGRANPYRRATKSAAKSPSGSACALIREASLRMTSARSALARGAGLRIWALISCPRR